MELDYLTLHDFDLKDKRILLRLDINSPLDPTTNRILDDSRIIAAKPSLDSLRDAKVVVLAHQSRPGKEDFTSLRQHADLLKKVCSQRVSFVEDVMGPSAKTAISETRKGEVLVLDNVRLCAEENLEEKGEKLAKTNLVSRLAPLFDLYVNDAFATAHRSQASIVGFPSVLPSAAGLLLEKELAALSRLLREPERPSTYLLGGAKIEDKVPVIENILATGKADHVLVGGNVGKVFLRAAGQNFNESKEEWLIDATDSVQKASSILKKYGNQIVAPVDFGTLTDGKRLEVDGRDIAQAAGEVMDIGNKTSQIFARTITGSRTVVASGPMGVFEQAGFESGTRIVLEAMANSGAFTVIGGGHMAGYASILGIADRFSHVSTAGGAMLSLLAGEELPAITALVEAARRYRRTQKAS
jgi:phosphoglycerate kinase